MENNNRPIFDPYVASSNAQSQSKINNSPNSAINMTMPFGAFKFPEAPEIADIDGAITNATKYYEQQYMYYKYLNEVLNYKTKLLEYEKLVQQNAQKQTPPQSRQ